MKSNSLPVFLVTALALTATNLTGCTGNRGGKKAEAQSWEGAQGLEWTVPSPAPYHTFEVQPVIK